MTTERTYTLTGCLRSGPFYYLLKRGNAQTRREAFRTLRELKREGALLDVRIHRPRKPTT